jgi:hypothetical protein
VPPAGLTCLSDEQRGCWKQLPAMIPFKSQRSPLTASQAGRERLGEEVRPFHITTIGNASLFAAC